MQNSRIIVETDSREVARLQLCIAVFALILGGVTWPLWRSHGEYPSIPWLGMLVEIPSGVDRTLALGLGVSGFLMGIFSFFDRSFAEVGDFADRPSSRRRRLAISRSVWLVCLAGSVLLDQQRLQVWAWEFFWLTVFLHWATPTMALRCGRILVVGIYVYSGFSKLDAGFVQTQGPWLWQGLQRAIGMAETTWSSPPTLPMLAFPLGELAVAALLICRRSRLWGVIGAWVMHLTLLLTLGPLGWDQKPGVLLWNLFFLISVPMLFRTKPSTTSDAPSRRAADPVCLCLAGLLSIWPAFEGVGLCDHWPAWAVYSSRPEVVTLQIRDVDVSRLPVSLQSHVGPPEALSEWRPISIDQWSFEERGCPAYPQVRYRLAMAQHLERVSGVTLQVTVRSTPHRWTGIRETSEVTDLVAHNRRVFFWNTHSRRVVDSPPIALGDRLIAWSAQLAVVSYVLALLLNGRRTVDARPTRVMALVWTAGVFFLAAHFLCAFHFLHHWSLAAALRHTAQRTAEVTGWDWPGGLYINYAFLVFWAVDVVRVWLEFTGVRSVASRAWRRTVQGVFLFMMFNATVVFGPWHWTVVSVIFVIVWLGLRSRERTSTLG